MSNGLQFRKLDLHVHTFGSHDFSGISAAEIVETAINNGLEGIAVTDHNTGIAIDEIKEAAKETGLTIFPGVEITCRGGKSGLHVIALFDITKGTDHVTGLLSALGIPPDKQGTPSALADKEVVDVIDLIVDKWDGIAIPAHVNSSKGILCDMSGEQRTKTLQHPKLIAVEATDFENENKRERKRRVVDLLDGNDPTYQRKLAVYQASDCKHTDCGDEHCLKGIGHRCSYFKLEKINLEGLRQCFIDPDVRIRQDFEFKSWNYPYIKGVKISSGFLDEQEVEFHSGLTTILGSKGAGKSLLIEFVRFALNQEPIHPTIADDHLGKLNERLGEYGVVQVNFLDETGKEFEISRTYRELDRSPYDESIPYDPAQIFPALFLSQNEIIKIAEDEEEQLNFIDRFFDFRSYKMRINSLEQQLEKLDKLMADGLRAFAEVEELEGKVSTLEVELERLNKALSHPIFEKYKQLELKDRVFKEQISHLASVIEDVRVTRTRILKDVEPLIPESLSRDPAIQRNRDILKRTNELLADQISRLIKQIETERENVENEYRSWYPTLSAGIKEYEEHIKTMGSDFQGLALTRERNSRRMKEFKDQKVTAEKKKESVRSVSEERNKLLDNLQASYRDYSEERHNKCRKFQEDSSGKLRLRILDSSNKDEFRNRLLSLKRGSYLREDEINTICENINARDFVISLLRYDATKESNHLEGLAIDAKIELKRMKTLADFLLISIPYEELLSLQYKALPQDRPEIRYNVGEGHYQPLDRISVGQKCTAMLIMALSDGTMPIVIDQPEDSLDIRSIWDDMCLKLRTGKENRQFIFTTHNSSLAVASDTDCFVILEGAASRGKIVYSGSMDHMPVSEEVLRYLEGGPETYIMKYAKYRGSKND